MAVTRESDLYPLVREWLDGFLRARYRQAKIRVFDSSRKSLSRLIQESGLMANLPAEWPSWDIHVDIVGFALTAKTAQLTFVECKNAAITLDHLSQILGYSRVALPEFSFLIAPQGVSDSLRTLLLTHHRLDILNYDQRPGRWPRSIIVARWSEAASTLDADSIITGDMNRLGTL